MILPTESTTVIFGTLERHKARTRIRLLPMGQYDQVPKCYLLKIKHKMQQEAAVKDVLIDGTDYFIVTVKPVY